MCHICIILYYGLKISSYFVSIIITANFLISKRGEVKVGDFGILREMGTEADTTTNTSANNSINNSRISDASSINYDNDDSLLSVSRDTSVNQSQHSHSQYSINTNNNNDTSLLSDSKMVDEIDNDIKQAKEEVKSSHLHGE